MCNLSDGIYEYGEARGEINVLVRLVKKERLTVEEAAAEAKMTVEIFKEQL